MYIASQAEVAQELAASGDLPVIGTPGTVRQAAGAAYQALESIVDQCGGELSLPTRWILNEVHTSLERLRPC